MFAICTGLVGCPSGKRDCFSFQPATELSQFELERFDNRCKQSEGVDVKFIVLNNPYCLSGNDRVHIFLDEWCVFKGPFSYVADLKVPQKVIERGSAHVRLYVLRGDRIRNFQDKSVIPIGPEYSTIYGCFFPTNEHNDDQVHFFSAEYPYIM